MIPKPDVLKLLVVDDNPENIWPLIQELENEYQIITATNGKKALTIAFSEDKPDLIILDVMMPGMDGYEVCAKLKQNEYTREIPIIFLTGRSDSFNEAKGLELGAQDYITKPFSLPVIRIRIKSVLNLKKEMDRRRLLKTELQRLNFDLDNQVQRKMAELQGAKEALQAYEEKYHDLFQTPNLTRKESKTILVVDDNPANIHILVENLEDEYTVVYATSGQKALDIAFSHDRPDLFLLDIMMPELNGYDVCSRLKANGDTWDIPIIFITALNQDKDETKGLLLGAVDFVTKPFSMPVVKARIKTALRLKEEMDNRIRLTQRLESLNQNLEYRIKERTIELELAHKKLQSSEEKYRTIFESAIEGIFQCTPEGRYLSISPSSARILGYDSPDELISTITDMSRQIYVEAQDWKELKRQVEQNGETFNFETRFKKKNNDQIWVMLCAKTVKDQTGAINYYQGFFTDITARKKAEETVRRNCQTQSVINNLLQISVEDIPFAILLQRALDLILDINWLVVESKGAIFMVEEEPNILTMKAFRGLSKEEVKHCAKSEFGRSLYGMVAKNQKIQFTAHVDQYHHEIYDVTAPHGHYIVPILLGGKTIGIVYLFVADDHKKDQKEFLNIFANTMAGIIERKQMIMERIKLSTSLRQAQKMEAIGTLAGGIAHDFNNILTAINGYAELAQRSLPAENSAVEDLAQVLNAGQRAKELVKQILTFSRNAENEQRPLNIHLIVKEALKLLRASIPTTITIRENINPNSGTVLADPTHIHQIVMNLCTNAYHAMRQDGGILTVELDNIEIDKTDIKVTDLHLDPRPYLVLQITDTGPGMDKATMNKIFEPYFTTKQKDEGTGLGLAVVHGIVKNHNGHVTVYSEEGKGTSFQVYLPRIVCDKNKTKVVMAEDAIQPGTENILIVDDEQLIVDMEKRILEILGYRVTAIDCSTEALRLFSKQPESFDLIITDMTMPKLTGLELAKKILAIRPDMPIIICSGFNELLSDDKVMSIGIREFMRKPIITKEMATVIRRVLDNDKR